MTYFFVPDMFAFASDDSMEKNIYILRKIFFFRKKLKQDRIYLYVPFIFLKIIQYKLHELEAKNAPCPQKQALIEPLRADKDLI